MTCIFDLLISDAAAVTPARYCIGQLLLHCPPASQPAMKGLCMPWLIRLSLLEASPLSISDSMSGRVA